MNESLTSDSRSGTRYTCHDAPHARHVRSQAHADPTRVPGVRGQAHVTGTITTFQFSCKFSSKYSSFLPPSKSEIASSGTSHFERSFQRPSEVKRFDDAALSTSSFPVEDPASILVWNMDATGTPLGPAVPETVELTIEGFHHLSSHEWMALERMRDVIGEAAVVSLLRSASPEDQKSAVVSFMHHKIMSSRKQVATPVSSLRTQVLLAMSNLAGRAKSWAYGKRLADLNCFPSYDHFKTELKKAFEPPQSEFRARAELLKLRQGRFDLHSYAQRAR
ncbi:putative retroelement, partial [Globisporangium splendens]